MKKILLVLITLLFVSGCGLTDEEKEDKLYESIEKAYLAAYATEGAGFAVFENETENVNGETWYKVAISDYNSIKKIKALANDVYVDDVATEINNKVDKKYKEVKGNLYTPSNTNCKLLYSYNDKLLGNIKNDVEITEMKSKKITFKLKDKEYNAKLKGDYYIFEEKLFECI